MAPMRMVVTQIEKLANIIATIESPRLLVRAHIVMSSTMSIDVGMQKQLVRTFGSVLAAIVCRSEGGKLSARNSC